MGRRGRRKRIDVGIYEDTTGIAIVVRIGNLAREHRYPHGTPYETLLLKRAQHYGELVKSAPRPAERGSLRRDITRYLERVAHLAGHDSVKAHLGAWLEPLGDKARIAITRDDLMVVRSMWATSGLAPKTCNNRISALRALYHVLDGDDAPTPADRLKPLSTHRTPAVSVDDALILAVDVELQAHEQAGLLRDQKTRARFRVRASTGRRPSEIMRAQPTDVDLRRRIWTPRDGKGGFTPGIYLTDSMLAAWQLFIQAAAWGPWDTRSMARVLRNCGWPESVRPYNLRHSVGIALSEAGVDLADVQQFMGHRHQATTRKHYVPVLNSRMQKASETLTDRLSWQTVPRSRATVDDENP